MGAGPKLYKNFIKISVEIQNFNYIIIAAVCKDEFAMLVRIEGVLLAYAEQIYYI